MSCSETRFTTPLVTGSSPSGSPTTSPSASPGATPSPTATEPATHTGTAARLKALDNQLKAGIDDWLASGESYKSRAFYELKLIGLEAQKLYRKLARDRDLSRRVLAKVSGRLKWKLQANIKAARRLSVLVTPLKPPVRMRTKSPAPPKQLLRIYKEAQRRFGVPWWILSSVNFIESKYGRLNGPSSAGAMGPMQFMPATWDAYGRGNIMDPYNSIMAAARYLSASGAPERMRDALFAYNHSDAYVDAILIYARQMKADVRNYYGYYLWQVFVRTTEGDLQLTGPGHD